MKLRNAWKILPILSAMTLAACFVAYRSEQAKPSSGPSASPAGGKTVMPGSKNPNRPVVFPSSKGLTSGDQPINRNNIDAILNKEDMPKGRKTVFPSSKNIDAVLSPGSVFSPFSGISVDGIPPDPDEVIPPLEIPSDSGEKQSAKPKP